ncbi:hypothetical protein [uncultured Helicobacter sp.]|uniref:hypothetical protein n=1 Tax=uncultured Helicobacter sp. TaxID=175537 RepID=UPI00374F09BC
MAQDIDTRIFKEFLQYDLTSGSLWEIVEIFERHRANFKNEISQYQQEIAQAKKELGELREQITKIKSAQSTQAPSSIPPKKPKKSSKHKPTEAIPQDYRQRILDLELENRRLEIELRDLKQEIELNERESKQKLSPMLSPKSHTKAPKSAQNLPSPKDTKDNA